MTTKDDSYIENLAAAEVEDGAPSWLPVATFVLALVTFLLLAAGGSVEDWRARELNRRLDVLEVRCQ